jgi:hypothetical protein
MVNRILGQRFDRPIATHGDPKSVTALGALSAVSVGTPRAGVTTSPDRPRVTVGGGEGPPGPPGADYATADAAPAMAGDPPPAAEPVPEVAGMEPAVVAAEDVRPAATSAGAFPGQESGPPGHEEPAPAEAAPPQTGTVQTDGAQPDGARPGTGDEPRRNTHRAAWLLGGGLAAVAVVIVVLFLVLRSPGPSPVTPLSKLLPANTQGCQRQGTDVNGYIYSGATTVFVCTSTSGEPFYALQFDNDSDYSAGLTQMNNQIAWNASQATVGSTCPSAGTYGKKSWSTSANPARSDQFIECINGQGRLTELITMPSQRAILAGQVSTLTTPSG